MRQTNVLTWWTATAFLCSVLALPAAWAQAPETKPGSETKTGKSHLIAAMIRQIGREGLRPLGLSAQPANLGWHRDYVAQFCDPLFQDGRAIGRTLRFQAAET